MRIAIQQPSRVTALGDILPSTEQVFEGEKLRFQLRKMWQNDSREHSRGLPVNVMRYLFEHYINQKLNQMLCEIPDTASEQILNDRRSPELIRNWNALDINRLQPETVRYLLGRANAIIKQMKYA